ncbi:MAG TPA: efflux RND transporter periplasmic adaptor subunit [Chthoniobacterales bacterium]|nr:efflux RND transporter periplasmic adaptor subunit [Chthoniobacterales bacterium]
MNVAAREAIGQMERRWGRTRVYVIGGAILLVLIVLILRGVAGRKKPPPPPAPRSVETAPVVQNDVPLYLDEIGTCTAFETVQVQAQVSGQIIGRQFQDGADVKKGDVLFTIDPRSYQAVLDQANGQVAQAQSQLVLDQITLKRQQELRARNVTSPQDLDTAQGTVNSDQAKLKSAQAAVTVAQVNFDYCTIRSPIDGRAGLRNVDTGNVVGPGGGTSLVTIQGIDPIYTDFTIAEPDLALVRRYLGGPNVKVMTDAEDDQYPPRQGDLSFIDNALQSGSGTVKARGITPNSDHALWPSQFVHVRLILDILKNAKLVPSGAVQIGQNGPYIFVVKPDSTLELREVKPGQRQDDLTVITKGVNAGETVVVSGQLQLSPGAKVVAQEAQPPGQGGGAAPSKSLK